MGISSDLQRLIVARLKAAVPSVAGRVYDNPAETATMPYISIGASQTVANGADCIRGRDEFLQVDIWTSNRPNKGTCKDITEAVADALDEWAPHDIAAQPIDVLTWDVQDDPRPGIVHGWVQIQAFVEA